MKAVVSSNVNDNDELLIPDILPGLSIFFLHGPLGCKFRWRLSEVGYLNISKVDF